MLTYSETKMKFIDKLPAKNIFAKSGRSVSLLIFSFILAIATFGGTLIVESLKNGLENLENRLGADIIVVPYQARTKESMESLLLNGNRTTFYMSSKYLSELSKIEGIEKITPQLFLSSLSAGCCSVSLQIIGFEPSTDFTVQAWSAETYKGKLADGEILVGSKITLPENGTLTFYGNTCGIAGQLKPTGSGLDNAVYTNFSTIKKMIEQAAKTPHSPTGKIDAENSISTIMIKVADGYSVKDIADYINIHERKVRAISAKTMTSDISDSLSSMTKIIRAMISVVWILCIVVMMIVFSMIINERKKEFAVLRVMGASQKKLSSLVVSESVILSVAGGICGILAVLVFGLAFKAAIQESLGLPYLMPGFLKIILLCISTVFISALSGTVASSVSAVKIAKQETGLILRDGN